MFFRQWHPSTQCSDITRNIYQVHLSIYFIYPVNIHIFQSGNEYQLFRYQLRTTTIIQSISFNMIWHIHWSDIMRYIYLSVWFFFTYPENIIHQQSHQQQGGDLQTGKSHQGNKCHTQAHTKSYEQKLKKNKHK